MLLLIKRFAILGEGGVRGGQRCFFDGASALMYSKAKHIFRSQVINSLLKDT